MISRAFWLALVCINYVYPNGISGVRRQPKFPFSAPFKSGDDLQQQILAVDRFCGIVIYTTILGAIITFGLLLGLLPLILWEFLKGDIWFFAPDNISVVLLLAIWFTSLTFWPLAYFEKSPSSPI